MNIAIFSDIHDKIANMRRAVNLALEADCAHLLFLGDIASNATLRELCKAWPHGMDLIRGNNDYADDEFCQILQETPHARYHAARADICIEGRKIYMTHTPYDGVLEAAESGQYDLVLFGHTHRHGQNAHGRTIVANPGDLESRFGEPSFAIYDTAAHSVRHIFL